MGDDVAGFLCPECGRVECACCPGCGLDDCICPESDDGHVEVPDDGWCDECGCPAGIGDCGGCIALGSLPEEDDWGTYA